MRRIKIFDTTLRDGEQSPGASMSIEEKVEMALMLEDLGVDLIEAGFPVSSPVQFEAVKRVASAVQKPIVVGLARCVEKDIDAAYEALKDRPKDKRMIHVFIATSPIHRKYKLRMEKKRSSRGSEDTSVTPNSSSTSWSSRRKTLRERRFPS